MFEYEMKPITDFPAIMAAVGFETAEQAVSERTGQVMHLPYCTTEDHPWRVESPVEGYRMPAARLSELLLAIGTGRGYLSVGPTGSGKTALIEFMGHELNWPVAFVACNEELTAEQMFGELVPGKGGGFRWADGPVAQAYRLGLMLVLDEYGQLTPEAKSGLNSVILRKKIALVRNEGEILVPHEHFRVLATGNSLGLGSIAGYAGEQDGNVANLSRFVKAVIGYPTAEMEESMLRANYGTQLATAFPPEVAGDLARDLPKLLVQVADLTRKSVETGQLTAPLSTRSLRDWVEVSILLGDVRAAFDLVYANTFFGSPEERAIAENAWTTAMTGKVSP